jgi:RND family efflux transporter MFP subunit
MTEQREKTPTVDKSQLLHSLTIDRQKEVNGARDRHWRIWVLTASAVAVAGVGLWFLVLRGPEQAYVTDTSTQQTEKTAVAQTREYEEEASKLKPQRTSGLVASGYVVARRKATIAAEITGKVAELKVEEGMTIKKGQLLAKLDSILAEKDVAQAKSGAKAAEAAVVAIKADLRDAERIFKRTKSLSNRSIASEADLTKAEARAAVLRAQLRQAEAQLMTARLVAQRAAAVLDKHQIRAPFDGVVVERSAQPGEMISPLSAGGGFTRTGICTIVDMNSIEIEVDVNEAFIGRLKKGAEVKAVLNAYPDWNIPAEVIAIVPTANREKATVKVRIGLKEKDTRILPDMAVKVTFLDKAPPVSHNDTADAELTPSNKQK